MMVQSAAISPTRIEPGPNARQHYEPVTRHTAEIYLGVGWIRFVGQPNRMLSCVVRLAGTINLAPTRPGALLSFICHDQAGKAYEAFVMEADYTQFMARKDLDVAC
jgi:hypothetical protein